MYKRDAKSSEDRLALLADAMRALADVAAPATEAFATIARRTGELLSAACGFASISDDGEWIRTVAFFDPEPDAVGTLERLLAEKPFSIAEHPFTHSLVSGEPHIARAAATDLAARFPDAADRAAWNTLDVREILFVPLRAQTTLGALAVLRRGRAAPFSENDIRLARSLADHAALSLANRRLLGQRERQIAVRAALSDAARDLAAATGDERTLIDLVGRRISDVFGDLCIVRRVGSDETWLDSAGSVHDRDEAVAAAVHAALATHQRANDGLAGNVFTSGRPMIVDATTVLEPSARTSYAAFSEKTGVTTLMVVPLRTQDRAVGVIAVCRRGQSAPYTPDDLALLEDLAAHAAVALMNSELLASGRREIAARARTEEVLRRGFLDAAPDAVLIADHSGTVILANVQAEALFGYARAELVGQSIEELVPDRYRATHAHHRASYGRRPITRSMGAGLDLYARRKDGTEFAAEIMLSPIETADGVLVAAAVRDVTERRREMDERNQRMEEANRLKSEFLANMSHELRTPLNAIIGFTALMHSGKAGPIAPTHHEYLGDILTSARHLLQLINDILDLAKVESGRMDLSFERVELEAVVREVRDIVRGLAAEKRLRITSEVSADVVVVDARMLKQVLYNFLSNAIKFSHAHGTIAIRIAWEGETELRVSVEDSGIGIAAKDMHRLFIEFQQLESGSTKRYGGTGLGLALVKRIVEAHGGRVEAVSAPGKGSTFSAIFPRAPRTGA